jgi:hypothetical protein
MNFNFGEVLVRAWKIIWKHKVLWIFGILASCGSGGGNSSGNSRSGNGDFSENPFANDMMRDVIAFFERAVEWIEENPWVIFAFVGVILVLWLLQIVLTNVGQIGLIRGAYHAEMGVEKIRFGELFTESLGYFWRMIGLWLVVWLPIILALVGIFVAFFFSLEGELLTEEAEIFGALGLFFLAFCCCLIPFMFVLGLYYLQVERALVLENKGVFSSLARGWQVFRENVVGIFVMGVVLTIVNLITSIIIGIPALIIAMPLMISFLRGNIETWQPFIVAGVFLCLYSPVAWVLNGIVMSYVQTVWTLIYTSVTKQPVEETNNPIILEANA